MDKTSNKHLAVLIYVALALTTLAVFWQLHNYDFINYDDPGYVSENAQVQAGLTCDSIIWAFTTGHAGNWHPLTWLSYMLDCQLFGTNPGWHHLTNLLLHIANTLLLFAVLKQMTGALWRSAFVAAVFALHPLHVESVAWISERKDVLSTLFWMLTMAAYLRYVKRPYVSWYVLTLLLFALGLMAKPMLVTLPFVLLLLDYWPLDRFQLRRDAKSIRLIREKVPFFILSAISSVVTFLVQQSGGAVTEINVVPLSIRIANAFISYLTYIEKMIWPSRLAVFYPYTVDTVSIWHTLFAALLLVGISVWVIRLAPKRRYLIVGWLWYLGTLVPVIGLVQVGAQAFADRYTYVPSIGIFIMVAWAADELPAKWRYRKLGLAVSAAVVLAALLICTRIQVRCWQNSFTLYGHALKVTENNYIIHGNLGGALQLEGELDEAIRHYRRALQIKPDDIKAHNNLAGALQSQGKLDEAISHYRQALRIKPDYVKAHYNLGIALESDGKLDEAVSHYRRAVQLERDHTGAHKNLGNILVQQDKLEEAITHFTEVLRFKPDLVEVLNNLAWLLATHSDTRLRDASRAVELAERASELTGGQNAEILDTLAAAYAAAGQFDRAVTTAQEALALASATGDDELANHIRKRLELYRQAEPGN